MTAVTRIDPEDPKSLLVQFRPGMLKPPGRSRGPVVSFASAEARIAARRLR